MSPKQERSAFGHLLYKYRRQAKDPDRGGQLTQERLAELLEFHAELPGYTGVRVSNWERGGANGETIRHDHRDLLVGLIRVLHQCDGIKSPQEANEWLTAGDYRDLNEAEIQIIDAVWLADMPTETLPDGQSAMIHGQRSVFTHQAATTVSTPTRPDNAPPPFMTPPLPPQGVFGRDDLLTAIVDQLQMEEEAGNVPPLALRGMGGIGKTTLSIALGRLNMVQQRFPDGILWTALGPNPTVRFLLEAWGRALGVDLLPERDEAACRNRLQELLYHRQALLIVDDVWEIQHGRFFLVGGPHCRTVVTTRELPVAHHLATRPRTLPVDVLSSQAALGLLYRLAPETGTNPTTANQLCERLEYLPLALTLAGRMLADEADIPSRMQRLTEELLERREARLQLLQAEGRLGIDEENPVSLQAILGLSVERMTALDRERFAMAAVFGGEPLTWKLDLAAHVWECSLAEAEKTTAHFIQRGLVERKGHDRYWMHALLADYAQELLDEMGL